ncbi:MAG: adenylate/guanylate cyclase domain-containing protein [Hyphomicrobiales bacterium]
MSRSRHGHRYNLGSVLTGCIAALVFLAAGSVLAVQWFSSQYVLSNLSNQLANSTLETLEDGVRTHLDPAAHLVIFIRNELESGRIQLSDRKKLELLITGAAAAAPQIGSVFVMDDSNLATLLTRNYRNQNYVVEQLDLKDNPGTTDAFLEAKTRGGLFWGEPIFLDDAGRTVINVRAPIVLNGSTVGMIAAAVSVAELTAFTKDTNSADEYTPFILYGGNSVLAHPRLGEFLVQASNEKPLMGIGEIGDQVIAGLPKAERYKPVFETDYEDLNIMQVETPNSEYFILTREFEGYSDKPLAVGVYAKIDTVVETFEPFHLAGVFGVIVLTLAMLGAFWLSRRLARPIADASGVAKAVGSLDFEHIHPMAQSRITELDDMSQSFNKMLGGLRTFSRYVPRGVVRKLIANGDAGAGSEERELVVMFTDMRNFTSLCEGKSANEVATFLNEHLTMLSECVEAEGGTIDKYIGDSVMAFWGAPDESEYAADRACRAALAMCARVEEANETRGGDRPKLGLRVGIHAGSLVVGDIGSPSRINYTVVGDVVNSTQRLEALGKEVDPDANTIVLISRAVREQLSDVFEVRAEGVHAVKGRRQTMDIFRLVSGPF